MGKWADLANVRLKEAGGRSKNQVQVYLAGPMRGYPSYNFPAFLQATDKLRVKGYTVFSPAENDLNNGFDPETGEYEDGKKFNLRQAMRDDLSWICEYADLIVVLPGWERSKGATAEVYTGYALGVPVLSLEEALDRELP